MRNNQDRFAASGAPNAPEPPSEANNSLFDFARPTEFVDLPTKGRFYSEAHPLKGKETVEIRYMTAKEEDILTSKTLLKSGMAIDRLIGSILVDKSINVASLYASDKNAILVACRISGFGPEYETRVNCPACGTSAPYMFDLNECRPYFGNEQLEVGDDGTFAVILPVTKIDARLKILNSKEEAFLTQLAENKAKKNLPESSWMC